MEIKFCRHFNPELEKGIENCLINHESNPLIYDGVHDKIKDLKIEVTENTLFITNLINGNWEKIIWLDNVVIKRVFFFREKSVKIQCTLDNDVWTIF